jgi:orotidine-5'-phosphate decarboxylase
MIGFTEKLDNAAAKNRSWLCVGLDPVLDKLPEGIARTPSGVVDFCQEIIKATSGVAAAYKPNIAFFEAFGADGWNMLADSIAVVPDHIPVILDAKRGDVGHTAKAYAEAYFGVLGVDAVTANPYLGRDAVEPFATWPGKAAIMLCLTSNPSAVEIQGMDVAGEPLYLRVARRIGEWDGTYGLVVGATKAEMIGDVRAVSPETVFLIPGVGAQGGDLEKSVTLGARASGGGALINASRAVIYASNGPDFAETAGVAAESVRAQIEAVEQGLRT